ncbi:MAG: transcriptional regulator [Deltaproteobacteria bacterium]|nr:MAG: transcriptional regulator [Deltaproteobacteria bacterium]
MRLAKDFQDTVRARAKEEKVFREALIVEAANALFQGDVLTGKSLIKDYLNATDAFSSVAAELGKDEKSIRRMLGPRGNPTLTNYMNIIKTCLGFEQMKLTVSGCR